MSDGLEFMDVLPSEGKSAVQPNPERDLALRRVAENMRVLAKQKRERAMDFYAPYPSQLKFHASPVSQRAIIAANRSGKTYAGAMEMAYHLTGEYPKWWTGRKFDRPIKAMAGSLTGELTRKGVQRQLMGPPEDESAAGSAAIPKAAIVGMSRKPGVPNALDNVVVKHRAGGNSVINFNSYDQGAGKWQADEVHVVWFDEEPPIDIYSEGVTRTATTDGIIFCTFTPLAAMHDVVDLYMKDPQGIREYFQMTLDDAKHLSEKAKAEMLATWPAHERAARSRGEPMLGEGRVFQTPEEVFTEDPIERIPDAWHVLAAIDIGTDHPTAGVFIAWDKDTDCIHLLKTYRRRAAAGEVVPVTLHAKAIKAMITPGTPVAWPHDGNQRDRGTGKPVAELYRAEGMKMLAKHATFVDGSNGIMDGIIEMQDRLETGRLKVNCNLSDFFEEYRVYHLKKGLIVKEKDDLISALRYAIMMRRYAQPWGKVKHERKRVKQKRALGLDYDVFNYGNRQ